MTDVTTWQAVLDGLLTPGLAAGLIIGVVFTLYSVRKGWISPGKIADLQAEVAALRAKVESMEHAAKKWNEMAEAALMKAQGNE